MKQAALARWLKIITVITGVMGLAFYAGVVPEIIREFGVSFPEFECLAVPSMAAIWATGVPCYIALFLFWGISARIGQDRSFSEENARALQWIGKLAIFDVVLCLGITAFLFINRAFNPGVLLVAFGIMFAGIAIAVAALALSHLVKKAAQLKEENDLTV